MEEEQQTDVTTDKKVGILGDLAMTEWELGCLGISHVQGVRFGDISIRVRGLSYQR